MPTVADGLDCARVRIGWLARAPFHARSRVRRNAAAMHRPNGPNHCGRRGSAPDSALMSTEHADHSPRARSQRRANYTMLRARAATSFATHDRGECRREDGCSGATLRTRERNDESNWTICAAPAARLGYALRTHTRMASALAGGAEAVRSVAADSCLSSIIPRYPRRTQRSSHAAAQAYATENGLAKTEPPPAAVTPACRYAPACMRTPRWKMPCSARK